MQFGMIYSYFNRFTHKSMVLYNLASFDSLDVQIFTEYI